MDKSLEEKINEITNSKNGDLVVTMIDAIYKETILDKKLKIIMKLLNDILKEINYKEIDKFEDFKVIYADVVKIDVDKFLQTNAEAIKSLNLNTKTDLGYNPNKKRQKDVLDIINGLVKSQEYRLQRYYTYAKVNGKTKNVLKYKLVKNN